MAKRQETMQRKPILMPPTMISRIDEIARKKKVSFAEVVREAVDAFDSELSQDNMVLLEAMADNLIESTRDTIKRIDELAQRLDETHAMLEATHGDR